MARAFKYKSDWKPGGTGYELRRWAEWAGICPEQKRRFGDNPPMTPIMPNILTHLLDGRRGYILAEAECRILRGMCRHLRARLRSKQFRETQARDALVYEVSRYHLCIAEWAKEWLMGNVTSEALQARFEAVKGRRGFPLDSTPTAKLRLYLKIVQFAF